MRPNWTRKFMLLATVIAALFVAGCPDTSIKLGAAVPMTGVDQTYGQSVQRGIEIAYEEMQEEGGYTSPITLLPIADTESNPENAAARLRDLYDSGAVAVVGGITTDEVNSMINVIDQYDRALISPSASSPELTGASRNFYRIWPSDFTAANKMATFAIDAELKSIVVVVERTYGKGIQKVFEESYTAEGDGQILEVIEIPENMGGDLGGLAERIITLEPDGVYLAAYEAGVSAMIRALRAANYEGRIMTTSAFATATAIANVGQDAEGVLLTQTAFETDSEHAHVQKFVQRYRAKYGDDPDLYAAHGYDALKVLAAAVDGRPAMGSEAHDGLREISEFPGVTGSIQFNEKGDVKKFPRVYVIGEDLGLYDHTERVNKQREELKKRREEIRKRLEQIQQKAEEIGS